MTITRMNPATLPDASKVGYSQISIAEPGRLAFVSGQVAWRAAGGPVPESLPEQTTIVIENLRAALAALEATPNDIAQLRIYATDLTGEAQATVMTQLASFLEGALPSLTGVAVAALASPDLLLEIEMIVRLPGALGRGLVGG